MQYFVGDVAHILGITPSALRFYEDKKIIYTRKTQSGRRYYEHSDLARLLSFKKYSAMGIPIKAVVQQFAQSGDSRHVIRERVEEKISTAREKAAYYEFLAGVIEGHAQQMRDIDRLNGQFEVFLRPALYLLNDPQDQLISKQPEVRDIMRQWVQGAPATRYTFFHPEAAPTMDADSLLGYIVQASDAHILRLPVDHPNVLTLPQSVCVRTIVEMDNSFDQGMRPFATIERYIREKNLRMTGVPLASLIVVESITNTHYRSFLDVTVPFAL
ncbi:MerR family transcriptional regulator [Christensenellaceae bacterium OttesenSCG-928-M15]|nr:MerR family transcriptional regulator [Christensenellaceae bacterium OttesenSCG-928-M15]